MGILEAVSLLAGVALFLFGMTLMGDGLKRVSGNKLEPILFKLSGTPIKALLLGTGVTAVIQSSSATSVMAVGFVNTGLMSLRQSVNVILGAILGTSITGWVLCLSYIEGTGSLSAILSTTTLTGVVAVVGVILLLHGRTTLQRNVGDILMGFAILMFGMHMMSGAVSGLGEQPWFTGMMTSMSHPLLGILVGAAFTAVLQSASAAVGILQALSVTGALAFDAVFPLLMGINIGAALPVLLSAIGATTEGKRAATVYLVAAVIGVLGCSVLFYAANAAFHFPFMNTVMDPFSTAFVNTLFRLMNLLLLAPFTGAIEALVKRLIPGSRNAGEKPMFQLEERFLSHPSLALEQSRVAMDEMADHTRSALRLAIGLLHEHSPEAYDRIIELEALVDRYEDQLGSYLMKLSGQALLPKQSGTVSLYLHTLSDFERISDHARNIAESTRELFEKQLLLSPEANGDLNILMDAVSEIMDVCIAAFREEDLETAARVEPLEEVIDLLEDQMKMRQIDRLQHRKGNILQNFVFNDLITNFERISDHCSNIALAILRLEEGSFDTHDYQEQLLQERDPAFEKTFEEYRRKFRLSDEAA
ncbi:MAG: Na/Pi cotransporter family protein [Oscillospiraceae bacterium]|nr:Na/Pi cotransporter family protein [Oscillospiraceae bacterium]